MNLIKENKYDSWILEYIEEQDGVNMEETTELEKKYYKNKLDCLYLA